MKLKSSYAKILIFCLTFLFFILSPLFVNQDSEKFFFEWHFPLQSLCLFFLSLFLVYINKNLLTARKDTKYQFFYNFLFPLTLCFCSLFALSLLIKGISLFFQNPDDIKTIKSPDNLKTWTFCILTFFFSAFYEESIYRFYFPDSLIYWADYQAEKKGISESKKKILIAAIEFAGCILFALAHSYAGIFSVINAFFAHIILRIFRKKTGNILTGFAAHFFYNIIELILITAS